MENKLSAIGIICTAEHQEKLETWCKDLALEINPLVNKGDKALKARLRMLESISCKFIIVDDDEIREDVDRHSLLYYVRQNEATKIIYIANHNTTKDDKYVKQILENEDFLVLLPRYYSTRDNECEQQLVSFITEEWSKDKLKDLIGAYPEFTKKRIFGKEKIVKEVVDPIKTEFEIRQDINSTLDDVDFFRSFRTGKPAEKQEEKITAESTKEPTDTLKEGIDSDKEVNSEEETETVEEKEPASDTGLKKSFAETNDEKNIPMGVQEEEKKNPRKYLWKTSEEEFEIKHHRDAISINEKNITANNLENRILNCVSGDLSSQEMEEEIRKLVQKEIKNNMANLVSTIRKEEEDGRKCKTYYVTGVKNGVGASHFAFAFAFAWANSDVNKKVALYLSKEDYMNASKFLTSENKDGEKLKFKGVVIHENDEEVSNEYVVRIVSLPTIEEIDYQSVYIKVGKLCVIYGGNPWDAPQLSKHVNKVRESRLLDKCIFCGFGASNETTEFLHSIVRDKKSVQFFNVPYETNIFNPRAKSNNSWNQLTGVQSNKNSNKKNKTSKNQNQQNTAQNQEEKNNNNREYKKKNEKEHSIIEAKETQVENEERIEAKEKMKEASSFAIAKLNKEESINEHHDDANSERNNVNPIEVIVEKFA